MKYYIDCEFDGHNGPLLSIALVTESPGISMHIQTKNEASDPWVKDNVMPVMAKHEADVFLSCPENEVGYHLLWAMSLDDTPRHIVADSPVDIGRFCRAISTAADGSWSSVNGDMTFEVHDVACYPTDLPGAVQHNAWWDALALRRKLTE